MDNAMGATASIGQAGTTIVDFFPLMKYLPLWLPGVGIMRKALDVRKIVRDAITRPFMMVEDELARRHANASLVATLIEDASRRGTLVEEKDDILGVGGVLYSAGTDTINTILLSFILAMTLHPHIYHKAQEEIDRVIVSKRLLDILDRESLPYVECVVKEVYRCNPPVPLSVAHKTMEDDEYRGNYIPNGIMVVPNLWGISRDTNVYTDPGTFAPERFLGLDTSAAEAVDPRNFVFGHGRRMCPGRYFSDMGVWLVIANIIAAFDIRKAKDSEGNEITPPVHYWLPESSACICLFYHSAIPKHCGIGDADADIEFYLICDNSRDMSRLEAKMASPSRVIRPHVCPSLSMEVPLTMAREYYGCVHTPLVATQYSVLSYRIHPIMSTRPDIQYYHHGAFTVEGGTLPDAVTAYRTYGDPQHPCIIVTMFYLGKLDGILNLDVFIGEDKALDPAKYFIVTFTSFAGGESSSPSNTPAPYNGPNFPKTNYADNIHAQYAVLTKHLGIKKAFCSIGYSMGGQQAYHWATMYPDFVDRFVSLCSAARTSEHTKCFHEGLRAAMFASKDFENGNYTTYPSSAVKAFSRVFTAWTYGRDWYQQQGYRIYGASTLEGFLSWAEAIFLQWDANDMLALLHTWNTGDISSVSGASLEETLAGIKPRGLIMPCSSDLFFSPTESKKEVSLMTNGSRLVTIDSICGHLVVACEPKDYAIIATEVRKFFEEV